MRPSKVCLGIVEPDVWYYVLMKKLVVSLLLSLLCFSAKASELKMIGTALAEFSIFNIDVYQISYYRGKDGHEELVLDYKVDVKRKYSIMGWEEGLKYFIKEKPSSQVKYDWIIEQVVDLKKGDKYVIRKEKERVSMIKNDKLIGQINDPIIASMVFEPWLGAIPVDEELKKKLLKNN